jgi:hypothetical protein
MVSRRKLRSFLTTLSLYVGAAVVIGYFFVNAFTGNHGLRAQQDLDQQYAELSYELKSLFTSSVCALRSALCTTLSCAFAVPRFTLLD